jgi:osmotically-inducible protein OsmY
MPFEDVQANKLVRRELNRRKIDVTLVNVRVSHGVVYLQGVVRSVRGGAPDARKEIEIVCRNLRQKGEIRDVVADLTYRS